MKYYNVKMLESQNENEHRWSAPDHDLKPSETETVVFNGTDWAIIPKSKLNQFYIDMGILTLSNREKLDAAGNIVPKDLEELHADGVITSEEYRTIRRAELQEALNEIDRKSIRPLREGNEALVKELENKAAELRAKWRDYA